MDKNAEIDGPSGYAAAMLICSAKRALRGMKIDVAAIIRRTGVPSAHGLRIAERLRKSRIWWRGALHHSGWHDPQTGGIAFWMDVAVGTGLMQRAQPLNGPGRTP